MEITVPFASYKFVRFFAIFGGLIGVLQSLIWIGLCVTAVLGYYCSITFDESTANFGTILQLTLYHMYIQGECTPTGLPTVEFQAIEGLNLMQPWTFHIFVWVLLGLSVVWLFSSFTLITNVKKSNLKYANIFLYIWILIGFVISIIDLVLFIFFVLDFETLLSHSFTQSLNFAPSTSSILLSAQLSASIMFSVSLRGYFLWAINMALILFLFTQTFKIYDYNKLTESGNENRTQGGGISNQPIRGYEIQENHPWYNYLTSDIPRARPQSFMRSHSVNPLEDSSHKRTTDVKVPTDNTSTFKRDKTNRHSNNVNNIGFVQTPAAGFEEKPQLRGGLRNSRYQ